MSRFVPRTCTELGEDGAPIEAGRSSDCDAGWEEGALEDGPPFEPEHLRDPGAGGYGIYVVFWFGKEHCQPPESGPRPSNAAELEERLRDSLSPEEARMIGVRVIDVARTPGRRQME